MKKAVLGYGLRDKSEKSLSSSLKKLILGVVIVTVSAFLLSTFVITKREREENARRDSENVLKTLSSNISSEMEKYTSISRLIMTEDRLVTFLRSDSWNVDIGMINDARYGIMDILNATEGVDCVMIIRDDLIMAATNRFTYKYDHEYMRLGEWKKDIDAAQGRAVFSLNSYSIAQKSDNKAVVTIGRAIYDIDTQNETGVMLMNISTNVFSRILRNLNYKNICILGEDGTFLAGNKDYEKYYGDMFSSTKVMHTNITENGENLLLSGCHVNDLPIIILRVSPYGTEGIPFRMLYILLFLLVVFIALAFYVATYIGKNITEPVLELSASMERNKRSGDLKKIDAKVPYSEFNMLEGDYNSMIDHVNDLFNKLVEKEKNLQKAEMRVLQEQIKPHFLYNSIETIGFMAMDAGAGKVHDALETLGSFYRNFLSKGDREIPLSKEVQIVRDYLSLQKLRYGDILDDEYDIADDTGDFIVPKLILQPLVENCIYHGIRLKGEKGTIKIKSYLDNGELHLIVHDTGVGMDEASITKVLNKKSSGKEDSDTDSFGLWGTIERIRYYTGREDVVKITSEIGEFTEVEFIIPGMQM